MTPQELHDRANACGLSTAPGDQLNDYVIYSAELVRFEEVTA